MDLKHDHWHSIFLFCLGLSIGTAFCMKWMEDDLLVNNEKFTIIGLELFYSKQKVVHIMSSLDSRVQTILRYHLFFDFVFMAGVYPGIASLCMKESKRVYVSRLKYLLYALAALQSLAWLADIYENLLLLHWTRQPSVGKEFAWYHPAVAAKWIIALAGATLGISLMIRKKKNS